MPSLISALLLALALPCVAHAAAPAFRAAGGAFFAVSTPDMKRSVAWYTGTLGLKVVMEPAADEKVRVAVLEGGGLMVELIQLADARAAGGAGPQAHGIFKAGLAVDDFDAAVETLKARGVKFVAGPFPARDGQRANVVFADDGGNLIQLFGDR